MIYQFYVKTYRCVYMYVCARAFIVFSEGFMSLEGYVTQL